MTKQTTQYINVNGTLLDLSTPRVMGILNVTPDSFYAQSRTQTEADMTRRVEQMLEEGADIIDIGGYSSRPGATDIPPQEELERLRRGLEAVHRVKPDAVTSVDTFRADVARRCVEEYGASIVNDISGGTLDADMLATAAQLHVPYVLTHLQGTPQDMQQAPHYDNLLREVFIYLAEKVQRLRDLGATDILIDPGFGFGKTLEHNYALLSRLQDFRLMGLPVLVGVSRKSMICRLLDIAPEDALNGTTVVNTLCLLKGANILRVHDVKQAVEAVKIVTKMKEEEKHVL